MEDFTVELDDETVAWLESIAAMQKKTISEIVAELIQEIPGSPLPAERNSD